MKGSVSFFRHVWRIIAGIPRGRVTTYGLIARSLGSPGAARTVGWALRAAPVRSGLPCHRVVNRQGTLSPEVVFGGADRQRALLEAEGIPFTVDGRVDLQRCLWTPCPETGDGVEQ